MRACVRASWRPLHSRDHRVRKGIEQDEGETNYGTLEREGAPHFTAGASSRSARAIGDPRRDPHPLLRNYGEIRRSDTAEESPDKRVYVPRVDIP